LSEFIETLTTTLGAQKSEAHSIAWRRGGSTIWSLCQRLCIRITQVLRQMIRVNLKRVCEQRRISVIERITLAPRHALVLVEADGERVLISIAQGAQATFFPLQRQQSMNDDSMTSKVQNIPSTESRFHAREDSSGRSVRAASKRRPKIMRQARRLA
jgi:flagellar biogenesis protein FliO